VLKSVLSLADLFLTGQEKGTSAGQPTTKNRPNSAGSWILGSPGFLIPAVISDQLRQEWCCRVIAGSQFLI